MKIVFLDTETTGLNGRLIQLAYKNRGEAEICVEYFKPPVPIEIEAMMTHHITEKHIADKQPFIDSNTHKSLAEQLKDSVMVAHNAAFDIGILKTEGIDTKNYICTYKVSHHLYGDYPNHKLQYLRYLWGIDIDEALAHDAKGDVLVLEKVFEKMVAEYAASNSLSEEEAIQHFIDISTKPVLLRKLHFGKHSGKTFQEIKDTDSSYLQWLSTLHDKGEDFLYTVKHYLSL